MGAHPRPTQLAFFELTPLPLPHYLRSCHLTLLFPNTPLCPSQSQSRPAAGIASPPEFQLFHANRGSLSSIFLFEVCLALFS